VAEVSRGSRGATLHSPGSGATSVKAEPSGSALESNASDKANAATHAAAGAIASQGHPKTGSSPHHRAQVGPGGLHGGLRSLRDRNMHHVQGVRGMMIPGGHVVAGPGFNSGAARCPEDTDTSTSSSMYSLLKSSEDFGCTGESSNNRTDSDEDKDKDKLDPDKQRPILKDPPWLQNVDMTPQVIYDYQIKTRPLSEVLMGDMEKLKQMYQPILVNDQLAQLLMEMETSGKTPNPLLYDELSSSSSGEGTSDFSAAESESNPGGVPGDSVSESTATKAQRDKRHKRKVKRQLAHEMNAIIHEADAPFPPPTHSPRHIPGGVLHAGRNPFTSRGGGGGSQASSVSAASSLWTVTGGASTDTSSCAVGSNAGSKSAGGKGVKGKSGGSGSAKGAAPSAGMGRVMPSSSAATSSPEVIGGSWSKPERSRVMTTTTTAVSDSGSSGAAVLSPVVSAHQQTSTSSSAIHSSVATTTTTTSAKGGQAMSIDEGIGSKDHSENVTDKTEKTSGESSSTSPRSGSN